MAPINLTKRCLCVITGASRGIGRSFAIEMAKKMASGSLMLLLARNLQDLSVVKREIEELRKNDVKVLVHSIDLQNVTETELRNLLKFDKNDYDVAICCHNVGTVGDINRWAATESDTAKWTDYFRINLFNVILLNNLFMAVTLGTPSRLILNVTSLCAIEPMKSLAYYCSGKAAREMFFRVLALENPDVTVLNYSPGMVDTEMAGELRSNSIDPELKSYTQEVFQNQSLLTPLQTTLKMLDVVANGNYKSGDHVDYHD